MKTFEYLMPTRIIFGNGEIARAGVLTREVGRRALVVTGKRAMRSSGILNRLLDYLESTGVDAVVFDRISPNPKVMEIDDGARYAKEHHCAVVIGLGGGSAIDGAKGIAVAAGCGKSIKEYILGSKMPGKAVLPIIAIPTTAGTGAEITRRAIISDMEGQTKRGIQGNAIFPKVAIVDPELSLSVPKNITAETGFDVLCHAIETYVSRRAQPITTLFSEEAIRIVSENLEEIVRDGSNLERRTNMMYASLLMGFNLANSSTCLPHRMQYPIGGRTDTSHGAGLASLFPSWLERVAPLEPRKFARIAELMGANATGLSELEGAERSIHLIKTLLTNIGMNIRLRHLGISFEGCSQLAGEVSGNLEDDLSFNGPRSIVELYEAAW